MSFKCVVTECYLSDFLGGQGLTTEGYRHYCHHVIDRCKPNTTKVIEVTFLFIAMGPYTALFSLAKCKKKCFLRKFIKIVADVIIVNFPDIAQHTCGVMHWFYTMK